jgi:hypothetical protein
MQYASSDRWIIAVINATRRRFNIPLEVCALEHAVCFSQDE